ncbi:hypothetical protein [Streptococcus suis]|nr:hypothetical protein [Streptococcus suis]
MNSFILWVEEFFGIIEISLMYHAVKIELDEWEQEEQQKWGNVWS